MKGYVGLDLSKKQIEAIRVIEGEKPQRQKFGTSKESILELTGWLRKDDTVAMEVGTFAFFLARYLEAAGYGCLVLNPRKLAVIYQTYKKTDKEDALKLAKLIQRIPAEELPTVAVPNEAEENYRQIVTERQAWTDMRIKAINKVHSLLVLAGITHVKKSGLKRSSARDHILAEAPSQFAAQLGRLCETINLYEDHIAKLDEAIEDALRENADFTVLAMSIPGVGKIMAFIMLAYLGDCKRFQSAAHIASYAGLTPRIDSSGETARYGRITKGCQPIKKTILQCSWSLIRSNDSGGLKSFYERLYGRIGKKKAAVATARKILTTFYTIMTKGETYWGTNISALNKKLKPIGLIA